MTQTLEHLKPETLVCDWRQQSRGARVIERPLDIMFDIDDVIFPTMMSIHELAYEAGLHNNDVQPAWRGWEAYQCDEQVYWDLWSTFAASGGYTATPPIQEGAEAMRSLYLAGHRIHLVTARGFMNHADDIRAWTPQWVEEYALPWHTLTFAQDKVAAMHDVLKAAPNPKNPCKRFFDYAIDDSPKNFEALWDAGVDAFLLNHPHNAEWQWHRAYDHRVGSVTEFADMILREHP